MNTIYYIDRLTGQKMKEKVYGQRALELLYGSGRLRRFISPSFIYLLSRWPFISAFYGYWQKHPSTVKKIRPFIATFAVDQTEFLDPVETFSSFNDFFIRRLKPEKRPLARGEDIAVMPADGRYYFYQNIDETTGFIVKNQKFNIATLLENEELASEYKEGSLAIVRLCPSDYHRFHFPCHCLPGETKLINGWLYSVNPLALRRDIEIFTKNKRTLCVLETEAFGKVLYLEVGATNVGSIHQTYMPFVEQEKGAEKGYFSFGASTLLLLFPKNSIQFDADLLQATQQGLEIRCLMGQRMGVKK